MIPTTVSSSRTLIPTTVPSSRTLIPTDLSNATAVTTSSGMSTTSDVADTLAKLLKVQTDVMAAQAKATALHNLPSLARYTGEGTDAVDDGFERWLERLQERAKFAGWTKEEHLYQLKIHLDKTALDVFQMLPEHERSTLESAVAALKKRFRPADIEELRGLEFHHRAQGPTETIEKLGLSIQQLGRKAFPSITGKEFDRLLKGRFYQALQVRWQRKLVCPKPDEGFHDLFARARMLEEHEKQYAASAVGRNDGKRPIPTGPRRPAPDRREKQDHVPDNLSPKPPENNPKPDGRRCYKCKQTGHVRKDCPMRPESPGRTPTNAVNSGITATPNPSESPPELTERQLEELLAAKRLQREKQLLDSTTSVVTSTTELVQTGAVGKLIYLPVQIEGMTVEAMLDTGSQSTIISRSTLHALKTQLCQDGKELQRSK